MMHPIYHYDPTDPMGFYYDPLPENATQEDYEELQRLTLKMLVRTIVTGFILLAAFAIISLMTSCTPQKIISSDVTDHRITDMLQRMDSLMATHTVVQQDSAWRETILKQFQSIREKSDTSHSVTLSASGDTIREKIIINNVRETTSETDRHEREVMMHRLEVMDSTMNIMRQQIAHSDSLLQQQKQTEIKEVPKPLSWWQQLQMWMGRLVLVALAVCAGWWIVKKRTWWLALLKKFV